MLEVERFVVNALETNCYFIKEKESGLCAVVDPGGMPPQLEELLTQQARAVRYILLTHGHFDHICAALAVKQITGAKIVLCVEEKNFLQDPALNLSDMFMPEALPPFEADVLLHENETVLLGGTKITLLRTPGHTSGGACFLADGVLFSGDTLMKGTIGRTDLPTGSPAAMQQSLQKLKNLAGDYSVYPGHGESTTLRYERENNLYLGNSIHENLY